jgi:hypothetical protein
MSTMKIQSHAGAVLLVALSLGLGLGSLAHTQTHSPLPNTTQKGTAMPSHATGTFEVKLLPQPPEDKAEGSTLARMSIDKQFHGDLEGVSKGQMLTAGTDVKGSAGYVAIERITGTLQGRSGSFVLQHSGTLTRGAPQQSITVVPDSGTGQLASLTGKMTINIADGKHSYDFDYTLPEKP